MMINLKPRKRTRRVGRAGIPSTRLSTHHTFLPSSRLFRCSLQLGVSVRLLLDLDCTLHNLQRHKVGWEAAVWLALNIREPGGGITLPFVAPSVHSSSRCRTHYCELSVRTVKGFADPISLRLFLSPYFSISVAMHYLKTYPESIGISHYLCWRMKSMPADEVEFYWPQIW